MNEAPIKKESIFKKPWMQSISIFVVIFGLLGGFIFWQVQKGEIYIEDSYLDAPIVNLSPSTPGTLNELYVKEGDVVEANEQVALVGSQILTVKESGIVTFAPNVLGTYFAPGVTVVSFVKNKELKIIGTLDETKGLDKIISGQAVTFTVDAFPRKTYKGFIDTISPSSNDTGVAFAISDKRPIKKFNVTAHFDIASYPELKNGMSAKMTVNIRK